MSIDHAQLATLVAVLRAGSFEKASQSLHVTPSAVSQRIKQLEEAVGGIVVIRAAQARATPLGESLYRHGLQIELLERELEATLGSDQTAAATQLPPISIAVNADSLATWLSPALAAFSRATGAPLEVFVDDQDHTTDWLRSGRVLGAITTEAHAVQGCRVLPLGLMCYRANASPAFMRRCFGDGPSAEAFHRAPLVAFNRKDLLHEQFLRQIGVREAPAATHLLPSPMAIVEACLAGIGWSVNPEPLVIKHLARKRLLDLVPGHVLTVPLYWQCWSMRSQSLLTLTDCLRAQAALSLARA